MGTWITLFVDTQVINNLTVYAYRYQINNQEVEATGVFKPVISRAELGQVYATVKALEAVQQSLISHRTKASGITVYLENILVREWIKEFNTNKSIRITDKSTAIYQGFAYALKGLNCRIVVEPLRTEISEEMRAKHLPFLKQKFGGMLNLI